MYVRRQLFLTTLLQVLNAANSLIAYDCGHSNINITAVSLIQVEDCKIEQEQTQTQQEEIQLIQLTESAITHTYQCKINIIQSVFHCGMFSHLSLVPGGISTFIQEISYENCMKLHKSGTYQLINGRILADIKPNSTSSFSEVTAGSIDQTGSCQGTQYTFGGHSWKNVIVMQALTITITDCTSTVMLEENKILIRDRVACTYLTGQCTDPEYGMSFWDITPQSSCESAKYDVLWEGKANKIINLRNTTSLRSNVVYMVNSEDQVFALEIRKEIPVCNVKGYQTEHPRLIIVPKLSGTYFFTRKPINTKNLDILTYVNSKFVYTERHLKQQIEQLYINLVTRRCELEKEVLQTQLSLAQHGPEEFALRYMKTQGYNAIPRGEIIYIIKCQPVEVTIRQTNKCYNELPVSYNNQSFFMTPRTRLLQEIGTEVNCSPLINSAYNILGEWYGLNPSIHRIKNPKILKPSTNRDWIYEDPGNLMQAGIYPPESLDDLRRQVMYPSERQAITNIITKRLRGENIDHQEINALNLFTPGAIHDAVESMKTRIWDTIIELGEIYLFILGIYTIFKAIKFMCDITLNARRIYQVYGWNWRITAATWNVMTNYVIQKHQKTNSHDLTEKENEVPQVTVIPSSSPNYSPTISSPSVQPNNIEANIEHLNTLQERTKLYPSIPMEG